MLRERWYERRKRALTLAMLPDERYARAYEPGCATGELSAALASRCDALLAADLNPDAVELARRRVARLGNVQVEQRAIPDDWPDGRFDLLVVSELPTISTKASCRGFVGASPNRSHRAGRSSRVTGGNRSQRWPHSGDFVHDELNATLPFARLSHYRDEDMVLDVWSSNADSVHRREAK